MRFVEEVSLRGSPLSSLGADEPPVKTKADYAPELIEQIRSKYVAGGIKIGIATLASGVWAWTFGATSGIHLQYRNIGIQIDQWSTRLLRCARDGKSGDSDGCFSPYRERAPGIAAQFNWDDWIKFAEEISRNIDGYTKLAWNSTPLVLAFNTIRKAPEEWHNAAKPENLPWYVWVGGGLVALGLVGWVTGNVATIASVVSPRRRSLGGLNTKSRRRRRRR